MDTKKHTAFGNALHGIGAFISTIFHGKITAKNIIDSATDLAAIANVYQEVAADTHGITDPAKQVEAITGSILKHQHELPASLQGTEVEQFIITACQKLSKLPLEVIEGIVKMELDKIKGK